MISQIYKDFQMKVFDAENLAADIEKCYADICEKHKSLKYDEIADKLVNYVEEVTEAYAEIGRRLARTGIVLKDLQVSYQMMLRGEIEKLGEEMVLRKLKRDDVKIPCNEISEVLPEKTGIRFSRSLISDGTPPTIDVTLVDDLVEYSISNIMDTKVLNIRNKINYIYDTIIHSLSQAHTLCAVNIDQLKKDSGMLLEAAENTEFGNYPSQKRFFDNALSTSYGACRKYVYSVSQVLHVLYIFLDNEIKNIEIMEKALEFYCNTANAIYSI